MTPRHSPRGIGNGNGECGGWEWCPWQVRESGRRGPLLDGPRPDITGPQLVDKRASAAGAACACSFAPPQGRKNLAYICACVGGAHTSHMTCARARAHTPHTHRTATHPRRFDSSTTHKNMNTIPYIPYTTYRCRRNTDVRTYEQIRQSRRAPCSTGARWHRMRVCVRAV